jgi:hypothetical protein
MDETKIAELIKLEHASLREELRGLKNQYGGQPIWGSSLNFQF